MTMPTDSELIAASATMRQAQAAHTTEIANQLLALTALITSGRTGAVDLYPYGLPKMLDDLNNVAAMVAAQLTPPAA